MFIVIRNWNIALRWSASSLSTIAINIALLWSEERGALYNCAF